MISDRSVAEAHEEPLTGRVTIHAVVRSRRTDRAMDSLGRRADTPAFDLVTDREIAAVITPEPAKRGDRELKDHERVVSSLLRRSSVVPMPFGLTAPDVDSVLTFLRQERIPLLEALEYLEDIYEVRVHVSATGLTGDSVAVQETGATIFAEARAGARGARLLDAREGSVLDAAFLIRRGEWIHFVERLTDWERRIGGLQVDLTGPWPAWDFVQLATCDPNGVENGE